VTLGIGDIIDGKYRIVRLIGEGGMGSVFEGENTRIRRRVAIKVLSSQLVANEELIARFEREAQAAGQIGNDHILEVLDLGSLPSGERYMVLEYLDGETLADRMKRLIRLTPQQLVPLARQFLSALSAAHAAGIIHRDLKPENIFILRGKAGRLDFVKLIDFGVSKFGNLGPDAFRATRAGTIVGTPVYMSPEQARGTGEADVRSDIFAVGVILYEAITGKLPFEGVESFNDLMFKIALEDPPPPRTYVPDLDPAFEAIILKAMARDPAKRYPAVDEFADALERWAEARCVPLSITPPRARMSSSDDFLPRATAAGIGPNVPASQQEVLGRTVPHETPPAMSSPIADITDGLADDAPFGRPRRKKLVYGVVGAMGLVGLVLIIAVLASSSKTPNVAAATGMPTASAPLAVPPLASSEIPDPPPAVSAEPALKPSVSTAQPRPSARPTTPAVLAKPSASAKPGSSGTKPSAKSGTDFGY
jgi:eukaryotic-like serine/threonine-protein kinase